METSRKHTMQLFLNRVFCKEGCIPLEEWQHWSEQNIHYPYQEDKVGGLSYTPITKNQSIIKTKTNTYNSKMNDLYNKNKDSENSRWIILDTKRDDFIPKVSFHFTAEDWYNAGKRFDAELQKSIPLKVEPLSPKSAEKAKKNIAEVLNRPLEIQHFQNPYIYPIGNPTKVAPTILTPSEGARLEKKQKTRANRNSI